MSTLLPTWIGERPLVECHELELPPPHLNDNTGDLDRLCRALHQHQRYPVTTSYHSLDHHIEQIHGGGYRVTAIVGWAGCHWELLDVVAGFPRPPVLAFAVDLGTSRLAFYLLDLRSRKILAEESVENPQIPHGEDILTRILFARQVDHRKHLQLLLIDCCNRAMGDLLDRAGLPAASVYAVTVAGNTTMSHFFAGLNPTRICKEPYIPAVNQFPMFRARDLGLAVCPDALVQLFPNVGSYFGGDLIAGILAAGLHRSEQVSILVDVGTNAEVVLGNRDWLIACAGAAGPALEGGVIERGMMAAPGAVDFLRIDPHTLEPSYRVIGGGKPRGICGSGVIDLIAEMFQTGILTIQGKINTKSSSPRMISTTDGPAYIIAYGRETEDGRDLLITDIDIGIFLKSKAAMYTILTVITNKVGVSFEDLDQFYVAGTFGNHIDPRMAIRIGMIPDLPLETYRGLGNTAGTGAAMVLLDRDLLRDIEQICGKITYVELNVNVELMNEFRGALFLPHTNPKLFPSVAIPDRTF